jgi:outer membrane protein TolC
MRWPASRTALLLVLASAAPAPAQPAARPLSLAEAIALASDASPEVAAARAGAEAAAAEARAASFFWMPGLSLDSVWDRTNLPARAFAQKLNRGDFTESDFAIDRLNDPGYDSNLETSAGLRLPLDLFGAGRAGAHAAEAGAFARNALARAAEGDAALETTKVYFAIVAADRSAVAAGKSLAAAREIEQTVSLRRDSGAALEADVLRVRTRRRQREVDLARARSDAALARSRMRVLLRWNPDQPIELSPDPDEASPPEISLEAWTERAMAQSPEIAASAATARVPAEMERRERASAWPALQAFGGYQDNRQESSGGKGSATVEVRLHWDLWDPGRASRRAAVAAAARQAGEIQRSAANAVRLDVEARWRDLALARLEAEAALQGRREAEEVYRVGRERWAAGKDSLADLLEAESADAASEADEARRTARVAVAVAALKRAAGER